MARLRDRLRRRLRDDDSRDVRADVDDAAGTGRTAATLPPAADDAANPDDRSRATSDVPDDPAGDAGQDDATRGRPAAGDSDVGSGDPTSSTPPPASPAHVPDAAAAFDPWGRRSSTSSDAPGGARRWADAFVGR